MNRIEQEGMCTKCGLPLIVTRTDGIPLHADCEKEVRQAAMHRKKKPDGWFSLRGYRYVPPTG